MQDEGKEIEKNERQYMAVHLLDRPWYAMTRAMAIAMAYHDMPRHVTRHVIAVAMVCHGLRWHAMAMP